MRAIQAKLEKSAMPRRRLAQPHRAAVEGLAGVVRSRRENLSCKFPSISERFAKDPGGIKLTGDHGPREGGFLEAG